MLQADSAVGVGVAAAGRQSGSSKGGGEVTGHAPGPPSHGRT
jgi:hypothetical protein